MADAARGDGHLGADLLAGDPTTARRPRGRLDRPLRRDSTAPRARTYRLAAEREPARARPRSGCSPRPSAEHGWSAGGHSVVEVVTDDMPFLVDSVTMELNAPGPRRPPGASTRSSSSSATSTGELLDGQPVDDGSVGAGPDALRESWMHVEIDRVPTTSDEPAAHRGALRRCCATSARRSRTGRRCSDQALRDRRRPRGEPAAAVRGGGRRRARSCSRGSPTTTSPSSATASTSLETDGDGGRGCSCGRPRHRARHPARRPGP